MSPDPLRVNTDLVIDELTRFLQVETYRAGFERGVLGLSGGVDSSVSAALAARALGPENVWAVLMPYRTSDPASLEDARLVVEATGVNHLVSEITPQVDLYYAQHPDADRIRRGNKMARERMSILYDHAKRLGALVVGTGNRTESLLGYTTMYGDNACDLNPLGPLLKAEVRQIARTLGLPPSVISKPPSADLWSGQTDEGELGFTYAEVDPLLHAMFDLGRSREELIAEGFRADLVDRVAEIHRATEHKRRPPLVATLSPQALGRS